MKLFKRKSKPIEQCQLSPDDLVEYPSDALAPGTHAPDFKLIAQYGEMISLGDFIGRPVILAFYPADWSPVCGDQMVLYNEVLPLFEDYDAQLLGISVDSIWSHRAFAADRGLKFPLLADFEPKGKIAREYGVYDDEQGNCRRALFVINDKGWIHWNYVSRPDVNPGANGILDALESLAEE